MTSIWRQDPTLEPRLRAAMAGGMSKKDALREFDLTTGQLAGAMMRFNIVRRNVRTELMPPLPETHLAVIEGRTLFPRQVQSVGRQPVLKPGRHNAKLGDLIEKGAWRGMPIYSLTLEERATCPRSCELWRTCYGGAMQFARRWRYEPALLRALAIEVRTLSRKHRFRPGFVVRLHTLGDFPDVEYVHFWANLLRLNPALRVWGYTHRSPDDPIGAAIAKLNADHWNRWAIRFSGTSLGPDRTITVTPGASLPRDSILCPVEAGQSRSCATCGLCWSPNAREKTVAFELHGQHKRDVS